MGQTHCLNSDKERDPPEVHTANASSFRTATEVVEGTGFKLLRSHPQLISTGAWYAPERGHCIVENTSLNSLMNASRLSIICCCCFFPHQAKPLPRPSPVVMERNSSNRRRLTIHSFNLARVLPSQPSAPATWIRVPCGLSDQDVCCRRTPYSVRGHEGMVKLLTDFVVVIVSRLGAL